MNTHEKKELKTYHRLHYFLCTSLPKA